MKNNTFLVVIVVALLLACITDLFIINQLINVYDIQPLTIELYQLRSDAMILNIVMLSFFIIITYALVEIVWNKMYIKRKNSQFGKKIGTQLNNILHILQTKDNDVLNPKSDDTPKDNHTRDIYPQFDKIEKSYADLVRDKPIREDYSLGGLGEMEYNRDDSRWWNRLTTDEQQLIRKNK